MTQLAPTFSQLKAQIAAIRKKIPDARSVLIRTKGRWSGESRRQDGDEAYFIRQCDSPLAIRLALREAGDNVTTVLVTDLDDLEIADDILVRLKPRKVVPLDSWQIVKALFQARSVDPRLTRHGWIAETLMDLIPTAGFPPVASGFLDAEVVWPILLHRLIGLSMETPDLLTVLKWSTQADHVARFRNAPPVFREAAIEWLVDLAGPTVATVLECVARYERSDALAIGLSAGVVFHSQTRGELAKASGKLEERYLGGHSPPQQTIERWAAAATDVVRLQLGDLRLKQQLLQRADEILHEVGAETYAWLSDTSPAGFDQRLAHFGRNLAKTLSARSKANLQALQTARQGLLQHDRSSRERRRIERIDMALRLLRWLTERVDSVEPGSLSEAASDQLHEGGFVDWARLTLRSGDPVRALSESYAKLFEAVSDIREMESRRFAELLRDWTAAKTTDNNMIPVEQILERIVAPLSAAMSVLVIVIDGMSVAVFRELMTDVLGQDWVLLAQEDTGLRPGLATLPSVTEASRTSLLSGRLTSGDSSTEQAAFAVHPGLLANCRSASPPKLFHKASLHEAEDGSLSAEIRKEIGSTHRKIVGVVVNAVDDHLLKGDQIDTHWTRDEIKALPALLHEAKNAGRLVILLSDHGHLIEYRTVEDGAKPGAPGRGERWRPDDRSPKSGELRVSGPRVVMPESKALIGPWSDKIRYAMKKNGYHGGLSPQEMIVPIAVLSATDAFPAGWSEAPVDLPAWWEVVGSNTEVESNPTPKLKPTKAREKPVGRLFDLEEHPPLPQLSSVTTESKPTPDWVTALLASPVFDEQKRLGVRAVPTNEVFTSLLTAISARGGKITSPALAKAIQFPLLRLNGMLAVAQRVLNVDGYPVLTRDEVSDTVELDRPLLLKQFDLSE